MYKVWAFAPKERDVFMRTLFVVLLLISSTAFAQSKVAVIKMIRGEATMSENGKTLQLKAEQWIPSGVIVKTGEKSFVRLVFIDKSVMNIGPSSEMKIEQFGGGDAGVIDLVKGKIRSQVSKDYLQQKDKDKSKMFIKTPNAVMGIRGTDFMISTNGINSSAVLFEGEVVFNKVANAAMREFSTNALEAAVDRGVRIFPGEFSVVEANRPNPTVPAVLNVQQIEKLEKNQDFSQDRGPSDQGAQASGKSVVPGGLSGDKVANQPSIDQELGQVGVAASGAASTEVKSIDIAKGFEQGDQIKPTNGAMLHVESGVIIPPSGDAVYDANTNTFVPTSEVGTVAASGDYVPPKHVEITDRGEVLVTSTGPDGKPSINEYKPRPIMPRDPNDKPLPPERLPMPPVGGPTPIPTSPLPERPQYDAPPNCSVCGGAIPGMAAGSSNTPVTVNPTIGDP